MTHTERKLKWCLNKAEKEGIKHRGLRGINSDAMMSDKQESRAQSCSYALSHRWGL